LKKELATELGSPAMGNVTGPLPWIGVKSNEPEWKKMSCLKYFKGSGKARGRHFNKIFMFRHRKN